MELKQNQVDEFFDKLPNEDKQEADRERPHDRRYNMGDRFRS